MRPDLDLDRIAQEFLDRQPLTDFCGAHGTIRYMNNSQGEKLCAYFWPIPNPKGIIQLMHGHGSYIPHEFLVTHAAGSPPVYENSWVQRLNQEGFSVCGLDQQGAGRSSGLRCYCSSFDEYVENGLLLTRECTEIGIEGFSKDLTKFLVGGSLGGCVAVMMALQKKKEFSGVALLAPMLSLEKVASKGMNRVLRPLGLIINAIAPKLKIVASPKSPFFPDLQTKFDMDPICKHGATRVRNAMEYQRVTSYLMKHLDTIDFPFIVFHSENDTMADVDGSKALFSEASSSDKTLRFVNNNWHVLVKEPGHEVILDEIIEWFNERLPSS